jgi:hypothetical protein
MLLQALDLLDRGLVLRIVMKPEDSELEQRLGEGKPTPEDERTEDNEGKLQRNTVYLVRSSQPPKSRFRDAGSAGGSGVVYTVRPESWNCSCAAFAFSSFPGSSTSSKSKPWGLRAQDGEEVMSGLDFDYGEGGVRAVAGDGEWQFGGVSLDGMEGQGGVPVCKHLLACLLGERWEGVLGKYVKERVVGREEMAGFGGEG